MARSSEAERKVRQLLQLLTCQTLRSEAWYQQQALWSHEDAVQTSQLQVPQSISEASNLLQNVSFHWHSTGILSAIYSEQSNFINFACLSVYLILKIKLIQFSQFKETQKLVSQISTLNYESV